MTVSKNPCLNPSKMADAIDPVSAFFLKLCLTNRLEESPVWYVNVITVLEVKFDDCVAHAIRLLYENNVSGAAITDPADSASKKSMDRDIGFIEFSSMVLWSLEVSDRSVVLSL